MSAAPSRDFNTALNGHRGLCALLVLGYHFGSAGVIAPLGGSPPAEFAALLWSTLRFGVEMFFMISGFVILGSLQRHATVGGFLRDRFIRIYSAWVPALVAVTVVCAVLQMKALANVTFAEGGGLFVANLLLLPPLVPLPMLHFGSWSLSYEWVFYLLAALGALVSRRRPSILFAVPWALSIAAFVLLFPRATFFMTGVAVYLNRDWLARHRRWLHQPLLSLLAFLLAWGMTGADKAHLSETWFDWIADGRWIAGGIAILASLHFFASLCVHDSRQLAFLESRTFQFLGNISYSFYLWHALVISAVKRLIEREVMPYLPPAASLAVFILATLVIALPLSWLSWNLFERRLGQALRGWLTQRAPLTGATGVA